MGLIGPSIRLSTRDWCTHFCIFIEGCPCPCEGLPWDLLGSAGSTASQSIDDCCQCVHFVWCISNLMEHDYGICILMMLEDKFLQHLVLLDIPEDTCLFLHLSTYQHRTAYQKSTSPTERNIHNSPCFARLGRTRSTFVRSTEPYLGSMGSMGPMRWSWTLCTTSCSTVDSTAWIHAAPGNLDFEGRRTLWTKAMNTTGKSTRLYRSVE